MNRVVIKKRLLINENKEKFIFYDIEINNLTKKEKNIIKYILEKYL